MKQVLIRRGTAIAAEVPSPNIGAGEILVKVAMSCISPGTESSGVQASGIPIWKRAIKQPENIAKTLQFAKEHGTRRTKQLISEKQNIEISPGYSAAGNVIAVGADVTDFAPGDRVACAGGGYAQHSEYIRVPKNLCVRITGELDWQSASTVALGSIALQGVRRAQPTLGETFVVIGLGILGQLTTQLLRAHGVRAIGMDLDQKRVACAKELGMHEAIRSDQGDAAEQVDRLTDGIGADGVIITAATASDSVVATAFKVSRRKGRVVLVGDVGLNLKRADFYAKEVDFLISASYGPGRYDQRYEEQGMDYPLGYVRWTENRNMEEYLRLLVEKRIQVKPLIGACYPVEEAEGAYKSLSGSADDKPLVVVLSYSATTEAPSQTVRVSPSLSTKSGMIRVALVGAGAFARSVHLPNLQSMTERYALQTVVAQTGSKATAVAKQFGAANASTDYYAVLEDPNIDAVIIATRHHLHGETALAALQAGKHVLVEKPLALNMGELDAIDTFFSENQERDVPILITGYNRRFSPYAAELLKVVASRNAPFILNYRTNAGYIDSDHWVHGPEGGGRNIGEACHFYDLFGFLADSEVVSASAHAIDPKSGTYRRNDNFVASLTYADGSVASLTYTAMGAAGFPKERAELYVDGSIVELDDYKKMVIHGASSRTIQTKRQDKGHKRELECFADAVNCGSWPISWASQYETAALAITVEQLIQPSS